MRFLPYTPSEKRKKSIDSSKPKDDHPSSRKTRIGWRKGTWTGWWWEEIAFLSLSWAFFLWVVILLGCGNHSPLSKWEPLKPNSVLAILTTLTRAALLVPIISCIGQLKWLHYRNPNSLDHLDLFDSTAPGPWGSLLLLFGMRRLDKVALLAWATALFSVLSLGIAPTVQQALTFDNQWMVANSTSASLGVATGFAESVETKIGISP
jgi:hypothetical protein